MHSFFERGKTSLRKRNTGSSDRATTLKIFQWNFKPQNILRYATLSHQLGNHAAVPRGAIFQLWILWSSPSEKGTWITIFFNLLNFSGITLKYWSFELCWECPLFLSANQFDNVCRVPLPADCLRPSRDLSLVPSCGNPILNLGPLRPLVTCYQTCEFGSLVWWIRSILSLWCLCIWFTKPSGTVSSSCYLFIQ